VLGHDRLGLPGQGLRHSRQDLTLHLGLEGLDRGFGGEGHGLECRCLGLLLHGQKVSLGLGLNGRERCLWHHDLQLGFEPLVLGLRLRLSGRGLRLDLGRDGTSLDLGLGPGLGRDGLGLNFCRSLDQWFDPNLGRSGLGLNFCLSLDLRLGPGLGRSSLGLHLSLDLGRDGLGL
jgi:hypothetical protein